MAEAYLKKWIVHCQTCGPCYCNCLEIPDECPCNPAHVVDKVEKLGQYPTAIILTSPDGTIWKIEIDNGGVLSTESV